MNGAPSFDKASFEVTYVSTCVSMGTMKITSDFGTTRLTQRNWTRATSRTADRCFGAPRELGVVGLYPCRGLFL